MPTESTTFQAHALNPHRPRRRVLPIVARVLGALVALILIAAIGGRLWLRHAMNSSLPQTEGTLHLPGLSAPVQVMRDGHGIPHIIAANVDDLVFAQGFVTAQDRLWQMDMLRRHVTGHMAEVLGSGLIEHDRTQRYLQLRESAERTLPQMPSEERHFLERYTEGVNAEMRAALPHLPVEFRLLGYQPQPWSALDSLLVGYAMVEDLSTGYPTKLNREAVEARLSAEGNDSHLPGELSGDLYPVGSFRDHPPAQGKPDLTSPPKGATDVPLDESQTLLASPRHLQDLLRAKSILSASVSALQCDSCAAGSNNWVVAGSHTKSGKPLVSNDPHLALTVPGIWYTADLETGAFHATGASIPGLPFIVVGHNAHVAWGFTNSTADVQDLYVEHLEGDSYRGADGTLHPLHHQSQEIVVKRGKTVRFDIALSEHGGIPTPILSPLYPGEKRSIALRWSIYDPAATGIPLQRVNAAANGTELLEAFRDYGSPAQNLVWGDDSGNIGYHLVGRIPMRGAGGQSGLTPVPVNSGTYEWTGYIPYDNLPAVTNPEDGVLATANARIAPDNYAYPISLDWGPPYRNERIWKVLENAPSGSTGLTADDMQRLQNDTFSALDKTYAERIAYAVDHSKAPSKRARQAADILRGWDGHVVAGAAAPNLTEATRHALAPMLLRTHLGDGWELYDWGESSYAIELMLEHMPARWLPAEFNDWNELLTAALERGLKDAHAPADLHAWSWGSTHTLEMSHPVFGKSALLRLISGAPSTGAQPMDGSGYTVRAFNGKHSASLRFTTDLADPEHATLSLPMGESGNPASAWFMDQWSTWYPGRMLPLPFSAGSGQARTLVLAP